jgi:hypothetical protein
VGVDLDNEVDCVRRVGLITRMMPSVVSLENAEVYMTTKTGCDRVFPVGEYLVIEPRDGSDDTRFLARIAESRFEDIYSIAKTPVLLLEQEAAMSVMHIPSIRLELVSECRGSDCRPPSRPPRIHSIVRVPEPGEVSRMLSLPEVGVLLGDLALPNGDVVEGNEVRLPLGALLHHVLVVGTTGSGKTTLLKSLAFNLVSQVDVTQGKVTVIALDTVGYYHHLFMNGVSVRVLLPITRDKLRVYLSRCKDERNDEKNLVRCLARSIAEDYVQNVIKNFDIDVKVKSKSYVYAIRRDSHAVRIKRIVLTVPNTGSTIVPYSVGLEDKRCFVQGS